MAWHSQSFVLSHEIELGGNQANGAPSSLESFKDSGYQKQSPLQHVVSKVTLGVMSIPCPFQPVRD